MVSEVIEIRTKIYDGTKKDVISFALGDKGRFCKYLKYMVKSLEMEKKNVSS